MGMQSKFPYRVLCLDGGGSKGVYTLGVLSEIEKRLSQPLSEHFDLVYGTSTGAIISALIALGRPVAEIKRHYFELVPKVMPHFLPSDRSDALGIEASRIFGELKFDSFVTDIGIIATNALFNTPLIFKRSGSQAFGAKSSFVPGFGCTIADALMASTAAYPLFSKHSVDTQNGNVEVVDGGFIANNPSILAITEALRYRERADLRVLSIGVGHYREPSKTFIHRLLFSLPSVKVVQLQLEASSNTTEIARQYAFADVRCVRIDDANTDKRFETDLLEADPKKLDLLFQFGCASYRKYEQRLDQELFVD